MSLDVEFDLKQAVQNVSRFRCYICYNRETQALFGVSPATDFCYSATKRTTEWWLHHYPNLDGSMWAEFYRWVEMSAKNKQVCVECLVELDNALVHSWDKLQESVVV